MLTHHLILKHFQYIFIFEAWIAVCSYLLLNLIYYQETGLFVYMEAVLIVEYSKFFTMGHGKLFVMMYGTQKRVLLLVGSWVSIIMSPIVVVTHFFLGARKSRDASIDLIQNR